MRKRKDASSLGAVVQISLNFRFFSLCVKEAEPMSCRKLISDLCLNVWQRPALSILQLQSSDHLISSDTICCPLPCMLHSKPWGLSPQQAAHPKQDSSHLSVKVKNSCLPKHVRVNLLSHPSTGDANFKLACEVCLWGDFYLVYPHLPSSRWATNFPAAETSACHTIIEVMMRKKKKSLRSHRPFKESNNTKIKACLLYTLSQATSSYLRCNFSKLLLLLHPGKQSQRRQHWLPTAGSISPCQDASSSQRSFLLAGARGIPVPTGTAQTFNPLSLESTEKTGLRQEVARVGFPWWRGGRLCKALSEKHTKHSQTPQPFFYCTWIQLQQWQTEKPFLIPIKWSIPYTGFLLLPWPQSYPSSLLLLSTNTLIRSLSLMMVWIMVLKWILFYDMVRHGTNAYWLSHCWIRELVETGS